MLLLIIKIIQITILLALASAMIIYHVWYNKPSPPVYYRRKKKTFENMEMRRRAFGPTR